MARALLLALTCAAAASAVSYVEYSGVKMPQYGGADYDIHDTQASRTSEDYHGHSPDAPASPDYKYEEESLTKTHTPMKEVDDSRAWRKSERKQKESLPYAETDRLRKYIHDDDEDVMSKFRTNRGSLKHRSRLKYDIETDEGSALPRRHNKYSRGRKEAFRDIDSKEYFNIDKDYRSDDKNKEFEDDVREETTPRARRRKPRDRQFKRPSESSDDYDDDLPRIKGDAENEPLSARSQETYRRHRLGIDQRKSPGQLRFQPQTVEDDEMREDPLKIIPGKFKLRGYNDYDDYYDMKRVNNIKSKLPSLLRRTTVSVESMLETKLLDVLQANRRMMEETEKSTGGSLSTQKARATRTATPISTTTVTDTTTEINVASAIVAHELSIAEKSRLSILKKAQRKEGMSFHSTKKPPVLLQVTSVMPTVVMVEPPSSTVAWFRARDEEDTPMRIELVKRLMRQKLVKEAKSIHDLTDNWDDTICDYIDVSLLTNGSGSCSLTICFVVISLLMCV